MRRLLELDLKPRDILTRQSFLNAITIVIILGGSTNAVRLPNVLSFIYLIAERSFTCSPLHELPMCPFPSTTFRKYLTERLTLLISSLYSVGSLKFPELTTT